MPIIFQDYLDNSIGDMTINKIKKSLNCDCKYNIYLYFLYGNQRGITIFYNKPSMYKKALFLKNIFIHNSLPVLLTTYYPSDFDIQIGICNLQTKDRKINFKLFSRCLNTFNVILENVIL